MEVMIRDGLKSVRLPTLTAVLYRADFRAPLVAAAPLRTIS